MGSVGCTPSILVADKGSWRVREITIKEGNGFAIETIGKTAFGQGGHCGQSHLELESKSFRKYVALSDEGDIDGRLTSILRSSIES